MKSNVSIIIPCFNKQSYVAASIESALSQTHVCEVIVIDDGSTDGSIDEIRKYEHEIKWVTGPNRGGCRARNAGVDLSSGDFLQFLDADDILPPTKISHQLQHLLRAPKASIAVSPWHFLHDCGGLDKATPRPYWKTYDAGIDLLLDMWISGGFFPIHSWLIPRLLAQKSGPWNENLTADQDGEYFGRILTLANRVVFTPETNVHYRVPPRGAVSREKSLRAAHSRMQAFAIVANCILAQRSDRKARRACLSRVRRTAYGLIEYGEILEEASNWEKRLHLFDLSPSLPPIARGIVAILGVERGLRALQQLKRIL